MDCFEDCNVTRRQFFKSLAGSALVVIAGSTVAEETSGVLRIPLAKVPKLQEVGDGVLLKIKGKKVLLIRKSKTEVSALNPTCRHKACDVLFKKEWKEIRCDCHGSVYSLAGEVKAPPAKENLWAYSAELQGDELLLNLDVVSDQHD